MITAHHESLVPAFVEMRGFTGLPDNWDAEGGVAPTAKAIVAAGELIVAVAERARIEDGRWLAPSSSAPIADGGLEVEWERPGLRVDAYIAPDGTYSYLIQRGIGADIAYSEAHVVPREHMTNVVASTILER